MDAHFSIKQTTMCCCQWNNINWSSSQKWRTPGLMLGPLLFLIHISDINYEIADSTVSCFADDSRILLGIKDEEDTQMLQNDLHKLCKWADTNNMKFIANKVELLRHVAIKFATTDKSWLWRFKCWWQWTSQRSRHNDEWHSHFHYSY